MMRMSEKFRYGLRAVVDLALQKAWRGSPARPVPLNSIVKRQGIPEDPKRVLALDMARGQPWKNPGEKDGNLLGF